MGRLKCLLSDFLNSKVIRWMAVKGFCTHPQAKEKQEISQMKKMCEKLSDASIAERLLD